jgi:hypothetical protein
MQAKQTFAATIQKQRERRYIVLPFNPDEVWGTKTRHCVTGTLAGHTIRGTLVLIKGDYVLPVGQSWLKSNPIDVTVEQEASLKPEGPQSGYLAEDLKRAFGESPQAAAFFDSLPTFHRNNYMRWVNSAQKPETRATRIHEMIELLKAGKRER